MKLAVLGDPLRYTRSPDLHRAGLETLGIECESRAILTPLADLGARLGELAKAGYRGVNLTHPLKEAALEHVARASDEARRARSVNTVGFEPEPPRGGNEADRANREAAAAWGETTDGPGFVDLLHARGREPEAERVVLLGAGGAARSLALALADLGCARIAASARRVEEARGRWSAIPGSALVAWRSPAEADALAAATVVVNATPLGGDEPPAPIVLLPRAVLVVDLVYGAELTPWVRSARAAGLEAFDGLGLLAFQARRSLALWTGREVPIEPLLAAVGWPR